MKKKGFTLVEIIICIALIAVIGIFSVVSINKATSGKGEEKILKKNESNFRDALEVYLSTHTEVLENVNNNVKAAVVSLELLKNEGLIKDDLDIDYKNNYFTLANAVLMPPDGDGEDECADQIEIKTFASWEIDDNATEVVYICPRTDEKEEETDVVIETSIDDLLKRIESLETALSLMNLGGDNWVLFDVNSKTSDITYFPDNNYQDLWSIVKIDLKTKEFKLLYSQDLITDNSKGYEDPDNIIYTSEKLCDDVYKYYYESSNSFSSRMSGNIKYIDISKNSVNVYSDGKDADGVIEYKTYYETEYWLVKKYGNKCHAFKKTYTDSKNIVRKHESTNSYFLKFTGNTNGWSIPEMIYKTYNSEGSLKKMLYNNINGKLRGDILEKKYYYKYTYANGTDKPAKLDSSATYQDKFGTVDDSDNLDIALNSFAARDFFIGRAYDSSTPAVGIAEITSGKILASTQFNLSSGSSLYDSSDIARRYDLVGGKTGYDYFTYNYVPVITVKYSSLLENYELYPPSYKEKYPDCTSDILGTKDCPKIIKLNSGNLSWGN